MADQNTRITELLDRIIADVPRKKRAIEQLLLARVTVPDLPFSVDPPIDVVQIPTFERGVSRPITAMLKDRFDYASSINHFNQVWLGAQHLAEAMSSEVVLRMHHSLRQHSERSAPNLYPDNQLTLFATTRQNPEDLVYLIWLVDKAEPMVWQSCGMDSQVFTNLEGFLEWVLA